MRKLIVAILRFYKVMISPFLPSACRYYPKLFRIHAPGSRKARRGARRMDGLKRVLRCHPFHSGGLDPVR
jgi:putative membrane protein insertion efficiency factor